LACAAVAQPAGNPRGSMAPGIGEAPKPAPSTGPMRPERAEGPLQSGPAAARTQRTEVPGGGTAGGLSNSAAPLGSASQRANESGMTNGAPQIRSQPPARP
ncbi:MAG: hypothetical protein KKC85_19585, partial [Gammaproteobacteria bacterium]|nr:hypothetical protein [Gammaproteobacteria bacterium]